MKKLFLALQKMKEGKILQSLKEARLANRKNFAVLVDPDKADEKHLLNLINLCEQTKVDFFFVGGSLLLNDQLNDCIGIIKRESKIPVIIFPGSPLQISEQADAILFLSLISGRNPELLIGQHVIAAPHLKKMILEILPTGYMLVDGGNSTTVSYISNTFPIPNDKPEIASCTAIAGEMLGLKLFYLDAGSGAHNPVSTEMIHEVSNNISSPLIVGGGIRNPETAQEACRAGADVIVVGNAFEKDPMLIAEISHSVHSVTSVTNVK